MMNIIHEDIEYIIKNIRGEISAVRSRIDEVYNLQLDNREEIDPAVNEAIDALLESFDDFNDCVEEVRDAIRDCED